MDIKRDISQREMTPVPHVEVSHWVEAAEIADSPLLMGTGTNKVRQLLHTGELRPYSIRQPWQEELVEGGKHLYYFYPQLPQLQRASPDFAQAYVDHARKKGVSDRGFEVLRLEQSALENYAFPNTLIDGIRELGVNVSWLEAYALAELLAPDIVVNDVFLQGEIMTDWDTEEENANHRARAHEVISTIGASRLRHALEHTLKRRGYLLYLKPEVLKRADVLLHLGVEDQTEVMLVADKPLQHTTIAGIRPLTGFDRDDLIAQAI